MMFNSDENDDYYKNYRIEGFNDTQSSSSSPIAESEPEAQPETQKPPFLGTTPIIITPPTTSRPKNNTQTKHQTFIQSYCGTDSLNMMTPSQISTYVILMQLTTSRYAIGEPLVKTDADFIEQHLFIHDNDDIDDSGNACSIAMKNIESYLQMLSPNTKIFNNTKHIFSYLPTSSPTIIYDNDTMHNDTISEIKPSETTKTRELRVKFNLAWSSSTIDVNKAEYVYNFTTWMNKPTSKIGAINQISQFGVRALYASNVRISLNNKPFATFAPTTIQPTTVKPTTAPVNNNESRIESIGITFIFTFFGIILLISLYSILFKTDLFLKIKKYFNDDDGEDDDQYDDNDDDQYDDNNDYRKVLDIDKEKEKINDEKIVNNNNNNAVIHNNTMATVSTTNTTTAHSTPNNSDWIDDWVNNKNNATTDNTYNNIRSIISTTTSSSCRSFLFNQSTNDELDTYYKNESLEIFRHKLQTYSLLFDDDDTIISYCITNVLLMNDNDCIQILNAIGCYVMNNNVSINEFELEANMLYKSYIWLKRNNQNNDNNYKKKRYFFILLFFYILNNLMFSIFCK